MIAVGRQGRTYIDAIMTWSAMMVPVVDRGHAPAYRSVLSVGWRHPHPVSGRRVHPVRRIYMYPMGRGNMSRRTLAGKHTGRQRQYEPADAGW